jgi:hypothetical protein
MALEPTDLNPTSQPDGIHLPMKDGEKPVDVLILIPAIQKWLSRLPAPPPDQAECFARVGEYRHMFESFASDKYDENSATIVIKCSDVVTFLDKGEPA